MKNLRNVLMGLCAISVSACTMPGLKYESGGSDVWKGEKGQPGYSPDATAKISEITPNLTIEMAQRALEKNRALQSQSPAAPAADRRAWNYRVGVGDVLSVIVWDHPELTNPTGATQGGETSGRTVRPDGSIFYPHAGSVPVDGKTTEEIGKLLTAGLSRVIQSPQVDVTVVQYRSQFVNIVGDVDQPCRVPITDTPLTVIDAINGCKTIRPSAGNREVELNRGGERRTVDLYSIYKGRDALFSQPLLGGDIVYVKDDRANRVFVVGEVTKQAAISIPVSGLTLADAINDKDVGGIKQEATDIKNVYVFRGGASEADIRSGQVTKAGFRPEVYHINMASADALLLADLFQLEPRDIVFASTASIVSYGRAVNLMFTPFSTLVQTGVLIQSVK